MSCCTCSDCVDEFASNETLRAELATAKEVLRDFSDVLDIYADPEAWHPEKVLVASDKLRHDLSETYWSRFTPGTAARSVLIAHKATVARLLGEK